MRLDGVAIITALAFAMLALSGCVFHYPSMTAVPVNQAAAAAERSEASPNIVCTDAQGKQCMVCDSNGGNCHFPIFALPNP
jgi:hypothetical protein